MLAQYALALCDDGLLTQALVNLAGVVAMVGLARLLAWDKAAERGPRVGAAPVAAMASPIGRRAGLQTLTLVTLTFSGQAIVGVVRERRRLWRSHPSTIVILSSIAARGSSSTR